VNKPNQLQTICAWSHTHDKTLKLREEELAESLGLTRDALMKVLSHGMCEGCEAVEMSIMDEILETRERITDSL
jgi:hypothetical protein